MSRSAGPWRVRRRLLLAVCILLWAGAFTASHAPAERLAELRVSDKTAHFVGYFVLGAWFSLTLAAYGTARLHRAALVIGAMILYAVVDETTQPLVNRHADMVDLAADVLGAACAVVVCEPLLRIVETRRRRRAASGHRTTGDA